MIQTAPLYYLCMSAVAQVLAVGVTVLLSRTGVLPANSLLVVALQAGIAFFTARTLKLSLPWQLLNLLLVPALFFYAHFGMPPWLALGGLILSLIIYVPTFWTRVPFYPTSAPMYEEILKRLPEDRDFTFIDLGCGYGTLLFFLAKYRPRGKFYGAEIAPLPFAVAFLRALPFGGRVRIQFTSFWGMDFKPFNFVYAFLAPDPMPRLWEKVQQELPKGSVFLVNTFRIDHHADEEVAVEDKHNCRLYVYRR